MKITFQQMMDQWHSYSADPASLVGTYMDSNIVDFVTKAGVLSKSYFLNSFVVGGFDGRKWPARKSAWGKRFTHPLMLDKERLKDSIKEDNSKMGPYGYHIRSAEHSYPEKGKRGKKRGNDQSYAAVHNTAPEHHEFTVNQKSDRKPEQRQFMGFSSALDGEIAGLIPSLFDRLPAKITE